jgi:hypothetical protein
MFFIIAIIGIGIPVLLALGFTIYHVVKDWRAMDKARAQKDGVKIATAPLTAANH